MKRLSALIIILLLNFGSTQANAEDSPEGNKVVINLICSRLFANLMFESLENVEFDLTIEGREGSKTMDYEIFSPNVSLKSDGIVGIRETNFSFMLGRLDSYNLDRRTGSIVEGITFDTSRPTHGNNRYYRFLQTKCKKAEMKF